MREVHNGYLLEGLAVPRPDGRWAVAVDISRMQQTPRNPPAPPMVPEGAPSAEKGAPAPPGGIAGISRRLYQADDGIGYLLEAEARREGINLGKSLIDRGLVSF